MNRSLEVRQRHLRKIVCVWNKHARLHAQVLPVFGSDHRVRGMIALSAEESPLWYPGVPISARHGRFTFKTGMAENPMPLPDVPPETWAGTYCMDDARWLERFMPSFGLPAGYPGPINMEGGRIRGYRVIDVVYEAGMHRVRWIELSLGWFRSKLVSVLDIPPLHQSLEPAPVIPAAQPEFIFDESIYDPDAGVSAPSAPDDADALSWGPARRRGVAGKMLRAALGAMRERPLKG